MTNTQPTTTHVAAPAVVVRGRVIQRCAVCGHKLADSHNTAVVVSHGRDTSFPVWGEGHLVRVDGNRTTDVGVFGKDETPADVCLDLVE